MLGFFMRLLKMREPVAGERWLMRGKENKSPWPHKSRIDYDYGRVDIIEAKDGWVRYKILGGAGMFDDCRMKVSAFVFIYAFDTEERYSEPK